MRPTTSRYPRRFLQFDWVVVSVAGVKRWGTLVLFLFLAGGVAGGVFYFLHEPIALKAERLLHGAMAAQVEVRRSGVSENLAGEYEQASHLLEEANRDFGKKDYPACIARADEAMHRFELLAGLTNREAAGSGQIVALQGKVEVQRANQTRWELAKEKQRLYNGDFVKTSADGSADIFLSDGTVYRVGPDSLMEMHSGAQPGPAAPAGEVKVRVGQVNVYTASSPSVVLTDVVRAEVEQDSRVGVDVAEDSSTVVSAYAGKALVQGKVGEKVELSSQQAVRAAPEGALGRRHAVPDAPLLEEPQANATINLDTDNRVTLRWRAVLGATGYHLQVSRSRLFVSPLEVDAANRKETAATLKVLRPGTYHWRVAALGRERVRSEWSPSRPFKALTGPRIEELTDVGPAKLEVQRATQVGHFFLVQGTTEPGASVTINGEPVNVAGDGTFRKAVVFNQAGWNTIVVRAVDAAGNTSEHRESVYVEVD
jgi:Glucodextranase, domain B